MNNSIPALKGLTNSSALKDIITPHYEQGLLPSMAMGPVCSCAFLRRRLWHSVPRLWVTYPYPTPYRMLARVQAVELCRSKSTCFGYAGGGSSRPVSSWTFVEARRYCQPGQNQLVDCSIHRVFFRCIDYLAKRDRKLRRRHLKTLRLELESGFLTVISSHATLHRVQKLMP